MSDVIWALVWLGVLSAGLGACVLLHHLGLASTYTRDLMHIGAGVWVLGFPVWQSRVAPTLIAVGAFAVTVLLPQLKNRFAWAGRVYESFTNRDEVWTGLILYTLSFAALTVASAGRHAFAAGAGLLALSLGDGIGGAIGRRFGSHRYRAPGGKPKSLEGSLVVAVAATTGSLIAARWFHVDLGLPRATALGTGAALAEALAPRGTDNVVVPAVVWGLAKVMV